MLSWKLSHCYSAWFENYEKIVLKIDRPFNDVLVKPIFGLKTIAVWIYYQFSWVGLARNSGQYLTIVVPNRTNIFKCQRYVMKEEKLIKMRQQLVIRSRHSIWKTCCATIKSGFKEMSPGQLYYVRTSDNMDGFNVHTHTRTHSWMERERDSDAIVMADYSIIANDDLTISHTMPVFDNSRRMRIRKTGRDVIMTTTTSTIMMTMIGVKNIVTRAALCLCSRQDTAKSTTSMTRIEWSSRWGRRMRETNHHRNHDCDQCDQ